MMRFLFKIPFLWVYLENWWLLTLDFKKTICEHIRLSHKVLKMIAERGSSYTGGLIPFILIVTMFGSFHINFILSGLVVLIGKMFTRVCPVFAFFGLSSFGSRRSSSFKQFGNLFALRCFVNIFKEIQVLIHTGKLYLCCTTSLRTVDIQILN